MVVIRRSYQGSGRAGRALDACEEHVDSVPAAYHSAPGLHSRFNVTWAVIGNEV